MTTLLLLLALTTARDPDLCFVGPKKVSLEQYQRDECFCGKQKFYCDWMLKAGENRVELTWTQRILLGRAVRILERPKQ